MAVALLVAAGSGDAPWRRPGPRRSCGRGPPDARVVARRAARRAAIDEIVVALPEGVAAPRRDASACAAAPTRSRVRARRAAPRPAGDAGGRPRRRAAAGRRRSSFARALAALRSTAATRRSPPRRCTDTVKEARSTASSRHARPLAAVGGPDAAGLPPRGAGGARWPSTRRRPRARRPTTRGSSSARAAPCGSCESSPENFKVTTPHDLRRRRAPAAISAVLTDYHVHLRPDDPSTAAAEALHAANADRYREVAEERGITELGVSEHIYRFNAALAVWEHPFWRAEARDDLDDYSASSARTPTCGWGSRPTSSSAARTGSRTSWRAPTGTTSSARCTSCGDQAVDHDGYDVWETTRDRPDEVWRRYFETLAEAARDGPVRHHRPPGSREGLGRPAPASRPATCAASTSRAMEAIAETRRRRSRSPPPGCASPSARSTRRAPFLEMASTRACPIALSSDAHAPDAPRLRLREGAGAARRASACASSPCSRAGSGGWSRSGDGRHDRHRVRRAPLRRRAGR